MDKISLLLFNKVGNKYRATRKFSVSSVNNKIHICKVLVLGGGSGGCTIASKFSRSTPAKNNVIILEPNPCHYYQPLWTLIGAGVTSLKESVRDMKSVLPSRALWLQDSAVEIYPDKCKVYTEKGDEINYDYLVISVGIKNDYHKIEGLKEALEMPGSGVSTIYDPCHVEKTFENFKSFRGGEALFTYPDSIIKCPGAPQKIAYLADSYFMKTGVRCKSRIIYNTNLPVIFGVKKYADELLKVVQKKNIMVNYKTTLKKIDPEKKEATFHMADLDNECGGYFTMPYNLLHATPHQSPPDVLSKNALLVDQNGYLDVNIHTLQHNKYSNIYGIGDCTNTPNSKTAAAIARQSYVLENNLLRTMKHCKPIFYYNGYGACPLVTSYNTCILAEFLYNGVVHETFPFDQSQESKMAYHMKRSLFPFIYWNFMLKGYYHGPEFVRKIVNPFAK